MEFILGFITGYLFYIGIFWFILCSYLVEKNMEFFAFVLTLIGIYLLASAFPTVATIHNMTTILVLWLSIGVIHSCYKWIRGCIKIKDLILTIKSTINQDNNNLVLDGKKFNELTKQFSKEDITFPFKYDICHASRSETGELLGYSGSKYFHELKDYAPNVKDNSHNILNWTLLWPYHLISEWTRYIPKILMYPLNYMSKKIFS